PRRPPPSLPHESGCAGGAAARSSKGAAPPPSLPPRNRVAPAEPALEARPDGLVHGLGAGARAAAATASRRPDQITASRRRRAISSVEEPGSAMRGFVGVPS